MPAEVLHDDSPSRPRRSRPSCRGSSFGGTFGCLEAAFRPDGADHTRGADSATDRHVEPERQPAVRVGPGGEEVDRHDREAVVPIAGQQRVSSVRCMRVASVSSPGTFPSALAAPQRRGRLPNRSTGPQSGGPCPIDAPRRGDSTRDRSPKARRSTGRRRPRSRRQQGRAESSAAANC